MAFGDLLEKVGSAGPFQLLCVLLLTAPALLIASHNLVQNFSAASPEHQCRPPPPGTNASWVGNTTAARGGLSLVPSPERCCCLVGTHGQHPRSNSSLGRAGETEPCRDGWYYDRSTFSSTIVTEVWLIHVPALIPSWRGMGGPWGCPSGVSTWPISLPAWHQELGKPKGGRVLSREEPAPHKHSGAAKGVEVPLWGMELGGQRHEGKRRTSRRARALIQTRVERT
uniref:Uncharacterized protein n=1 Tax=Chrysemys picta bellii TaxID=8478 RepID=A0A8C3IGZ8_CHRPI